ncbi:MAG: hypothetical protein OEM67_01965 [Thermoleophilia bacterium]|nr:hypothetical protein [Thermoleophilia bacterium]MDH3724660.1 hypothetical protein [Thermoleophilia bacterium]
MNDPDSPLSSEEREARRALLAESLAELPDAPDSGVAAADVVRALDHYIAAGGPPAVAVSPELRARLKAALGEVAEDGSPEAAARVVGAVDEYLETLSHSQVTREPSVTNFSVLPGSEIKWARWIVIILAVMASTVVAVTFQGGFLAGGIILAIWLVALIALGTS